MGLRLQNKNEDGSKALRHNKDGFNAPIQNKDGPKAQDKAKTKHELTSGLR